MNQPSFNDKVNKKNTISKYPNTWGLVTVKTNKTSKLLRLEAFMKTGGSKILILISSQ